MSYDGNAARRATVEVKNNPLAQERASVSRAADGQSVVTSTATNADWPRTQNGAPDFATMNAQQRRAYDVERLKRRFG